MKKLKMRINLVDKIDEIEDKVEKRQQHIWSLLLPLLLQAIIVKLHNDYSIWEQDEIAIT